MLKNLLPLQFPVPGCMDLRVITLECCGQSVVYNQLSLSNTSVNCSEAVPLININFDPITTAIDTKNLRLLVAGKDAS